MKKMFSSCSLQQLQIGNNPNNLNLETVESSLCNFHYNKVLCIKVAMHGEHTLVQTM